MAETAEIKVFNRWSAKGITVADDGLRDYIALEPKLVLRSAGRYVHSRFHKSKVFIVERLINRVTIPGHKGKKHFKSSGRMTGKTNTAYIIVKEAFKLVEQKTKKNPVEVFVKALENAAPREEVISIEYGGARYPKAVECAPQRRVDVALRLMTQGSFQRAFNSKKSIIEVLAEEIINAYYLSPNSVSIAKKLELERQADASR